MFTRCKSFKWHVYFLFLSIKSKDISVFSKVVVFNVFFSVFFGNKSYVFSNNLFFMIWLNTNAYYILFFQKFIFLGLFDI